MPVLPPFHTCPQFPTGPLPTTLRAKGGSDESDEEGEEEGLEAAGKEIAFPRKTIRMMLAQPRPSGSPTVASSAVGCLWANRKADEGASRVPSHGRHSRKDLQEVSSFNWAVTNWKQRMAKPEEGYGVEMDDAPLPTFSTKGLA